MSSSQYKNYKNTEVFDAFQKSEYRSTKHSNFFCIYDDLLKKFKNRDVTLVEIGVASGGSLFMWKNYFGNKARIIGIDFNPGSKKWEKHGFEIYIGNQSDPKFWKEFFEKIGKIDILIDDGGHTNEQQIVTFLNTFENINEEGLIIIEDTHTSYMKEFGNPSKYSFMNFCKKIIDEQNSKSIIDLAHKKYLKLIYKIEIYQSLVAFHFNSLKAEKNISIINNGKLVNSEDFRLRDIKLFTKIDKLKNHIRSNIPSGIYRILKKIYPYLKFIYFQIRNIKNKKFF